MSLSAVRNRIAEKAANNLAPPVLIVAYGDSVTQGLAALDEQIPDAVYHARLKRGLEAAYPQTTFSVVNSGYAGQTADGALANIERDVIRHQPDLTLIAFGLNDSLQLRQGRGPFRLALTTMIERIQAQTASDIILLTPNFMARADNPRVAAVHKPLVAPFTLVQNSGVLGEYAQTIRALGAAASVPVADVYAAWQALARAGIDTDAMLANGLNHPNAEAHAIPAALLLALLSAPVRATRRPRKKPVKS